MVPLVSVPFHGRAQGRAQGRRNATRTHGGGVAIREGVVWHTTRPFFAVPVLVFRPRPDDTRRASGEGLDGSDPPFLTAGAVSRLGGVAPVRMYPCGEGSPARARAGRSATPSGPIRDALLRAFLVIGDISAACAWTWPGVFPKADPVAVLVRYPTPNMYAAVVAWYDVAPGVAAFAYGGRPGDRRRGGPPPGQSHREPDPRMADNSRARTLYRRGDVRRGRLR